MRTFVMGDPHGGYRALMQCIERSGFDAENDRLVVLGDVADGWPEVKECFDYLMGLKSLVYIIGNHDVWLLQWLETGALPMAWVTQGGRATLDSFGGKVDPKVRDFLKAAPYWWQDEEGRMYVHGGFHPSKHPMEHTMEYVVWDRDLWHWAWISEMRGEQCTQFPEVFIGHTSTTFGVKKRPGSMEPVQMAEVWNLDQGAGWEGKLSIMNVETKEFWQSDVVSTLYPEVKGRG